MKMVKLSSMNYSQSIQELVRDVSTIGSFLGGQVVDSAALGQAIQNVGQTQFGFGMVLAALHQWKEEETEREEEINADSESMEEYIKDPALVAVLHDKPEWGSMATKLHDVLENIEGYSCHKVCHVYTATVDFVELLIENSNGETVLEVALRALHKDFKRSFFLYTNVQWKGKWLVAFKLATIKKMDADVFWNATLSMFENEMPEYWRDVYWSDEENCWLSMEDDD